MGRASTEGRIVAKQPIPIQNIYYLLCYAWNRFDVGKKIGSGAEQGAGIYDLFAKVLLHGISTLKKRGLDRGYKGYKEDLGSLRGKVDFGDSLKRNLFSQLQASCDFDVLSHNVLSNQILKATIKKLTLLESLNGELRHGLRSSLRLLPREIEDIRLTSSCFKRVNIHGNNDYYGFLIKVCELIYFNLLPTGKDGRYFFADILNDNKRMPGIFEGFIRNFYKLEQGAFNVGRDTIKWDSAEGSPEDINLLPMMITDISLGSKNRESKIIIETKFYPEALQESQWKKTLHSQHLYQLHAYLNNIESAVPVGTKLEGILLYPTVNQHLDLNYVIKGKPLRVYTIDLNKSWENIHQDLLNLIRTQA